MRQKTIIALLLISFLILGGLIARPCGFGRVILIDAWSEKLKVEIFDEQILLWSGVLGFGPPLNIRIRLTGDVSYRLRATDLSTGKIHEETFGYDSDGMSEVNLFLIDGKGIHFSEWQIEPLWKALALLGVDTLSCIDERK